MLDHASLQPLFDPRAVAVVGASDDPAKWGHWLGLRALRGAHRRRVHLVNRRAERVLGQVAHPSVGAVGEPVDLAVIAVPAAHLDAAVADAVAAGARVVVAITGSERDGDAGGALDAAVAARARDAGARLLGPNCLGVFDAAAELELVSNDLPAGSVGLISQSGNLGLEIGAKIQAAGLGFSRFVSLGNQADIQAAELVDALVEDPATRVIAAYVEDFVDGRAFTAAAARAVAAGKPVLLLAIEHSEAAARAVQSHTGALASDGAAIDAACRAAGIHRVGSPQELVDTAGALLGAPRARGRRVAVVADGGGHAGVAAGLAHAAGLEVPELAPEVRARLQAVLPPAAAVANPIDLAGGGEQDVSCFAAVTDVLLGSGSVDAVLLSGYFGGYAEYGLGEGELAAADAMAGTVESAGRPLVVHSMNADTPAIAALRARGVPCHDAIERALTAVSALVPRPAVTAGAPVPAAPPVASTDYTAVRSLLAEGGVPFVAAETVADAGAAVAAADRLGYPVVLKALGLLHKSDAGGVVLGLADAAAVRAAAVDLERRLAPPALSVERMAATSGGVELIVGARWDPRFGPLVLVGLGGVFTEALADVRLALAPVEPGEAEALLRGLRGAALLLGARGRPPVDIAACADAVAALSRVAAAHPELAELEVNPLLASPDGVLGLDARAIPA